MQLASSVQVCKLQQKHISRLPKKLARNRATLAQLMQNSVHIIMYVTEVCKSCASVGELLASFLADMICFSCNMQTC